MTSVIWASAHKSRYSALSDKATFGSEACTVGRACRGRGIFVGVSESYYGFSKGSARDTQIGPDESPELVLAAVVEMPAQIAARTGTGIALAI